MPELGAKIISLVDRRSGREWMWRAPKQPQYKRRPTGSAFDQGPLVGADECLPTIAACKWRGLSLTDHGEAWTEAWILDESKLNEDSIVTRLHLPISPLSVERTIRIKANMVRIEYSLHNLSAEGFEYLWAFHPMMTLESGDQILLPKSCQRVRIDACFGGCPLGDRGTEWGWPHPRPGIDLSQLDLGGAGRAAKVYTEPLTEGVASLWNQKAGDRLRFEFDVREIDTIGIWINRGGFGGFQHVALEPTNGAPDGLDIAVGEWKRFGCLDGGGMKQWSFQIRLS